MCDPSGTRIFLRMVLLPILQPEYVMEYVFVCDACQNLCKQVPRDARCPRCHGPLRRRPKQTPSFRNPDLAHRAPDMWRYCEALPRLTDRVSLGEVMTPLAPLTIEGRQVLVKCEHQLPTGSYKDRGSAVLMSYLRQTGVREAVEDSSGNAGASLAAYAARAGVRLRVFCPESAATGKLAQIERAGAELQRVPGPRASATRALLEYLQETEAVYASHLWHPLFLDGIETMAYEIAEQLGWVAPAAVLCPVGAGSILLGLFRGFSKLRQDGVMLRLPRLVAVQSSLADAVHRAFVSGAEDVAPAAPPRPTMAEGIALPAPVRGAEVLRAVRCTGGTVVTVDESEIAAGAEALARAGFGVEPTSAVVWHGFLQMQQLLHLPASAVIVCVLSGHGLKAATRANPLASVPKRRNPRK